MDPFRVKHVVNEVAGILANRPDLPNFKQHVRKMCWEVATLLLKGEAGYRSLNIVASNYQILRTNTEFAEHAVLCAATRWNADRASSGDADG